MQEFDRELTKLETFENLLFKKRVKGEKFCQDQLPALRRLWPMVLTELQPKRSWWQWLKGWLRW